MFQARDGSHIIVNQDLRTPNARSTSILSASSHFVNNFLLGPCGIGMVFTNVAMFDDRQVHRIAQVV